MIPQELYEEARRAYDVAYDAIFAQCMSDRDYDWQEDEADIEAFRAASEIYELVLRGE